MFQAILDVKGKGLNPCVWSLFCETCHFVVSFFAVSAVGVERAPAAVRCCGCGGPSNFHFRSGVSSQYLSLSAMTVVVVVIGVAVVVVVVVPFPRFGLFSVQRALFGGVG